MTLGSLPRFGRPSGVRVQLRRRLQSVGPCTARIDCGSWNRRRLLGVHCSHDLHARAGPAAGASWSSPRGLRQGNSQDEDRAGRTLTHARQPTEPVQGDVDAGARTDYLTSRESTPHLGSVEGIVRHDEGAGRFPCMAACLRTRPCIQEHLNHFAPRSQASLPPCPVPVPEPNGEGSDIHTSPLTDQEIGPPESR